MKFGQSSLFLRHLLQLSVALFCGLNLETAFAQAAAPTEGI
ncbi:MULTISPECIES: hypothetical protein [unclassified Moraxella]